MSLLCPGNSSATIEIFAAGQGARGNSDPADSAVRGWVAGLRSGVERADPPQLYAARPGELVDCELLGSPVTTVKGGYLRRTDNVRHLGMGSDHSILANCTPGHAFVAKYG